ncbi:MAG: hypothetical protein MJ192_03465 [Clostridia bacterium]|nr:hypothetical protein [Clostridia bacterium]
MTSESDQIPKNVPETDEEGEEMDETIRAILTAVDSCTSLEELKARLQEMLDETEAAAEEEEEEEEEEEDK